MPKVTTNTIGKKPDANPADQKLLDKKQRDLLRRERMRKFGEQLRFLVHDDSSPKLFGINGPVSYLLET
jgi:hypothetical protein